MKKGAFFLQEVFLEEKGVSVFTHSKILKKYCKEIFLLTTSTTYKSQQILENDFSYKIDDSIFSFTEQYEKYYNNCKDWAELYDKLNVTCLKNMDILYVIGGIDNPNSLLQRGSSRSFVFPRDRGQLKYMSVGKVLTNLLGILKAHREYKIPLHEVAFDPKELAYCLYHKDFQPLDNYYLYHGYDIPKYGIRRLDSNQCHLPAHFFEVEKDFDLVFGYTILNKSGREKYVSYIERLKNNFNKSLLFTKNYITGENSLQHKNVYMELIQRAKYTFMLPSYDKYCFSIYRFIESINENCLPLIHPDCNIEDVNKSFNVDLSELIRDNPFPEKERKEILEYFKSKFLNFEKGLIGV